MAKSVHAIFAHYDHARTFLDALIASGLPPGRICVVGEDSDSLRRATASLQSKRSNKRLFFMLIIGAVTGAIAGFVGMPSLTYVTSPLISSLSAVVAGLVVGAYTGVAMLVIMDLDNIPLSDAQFHLGKVDQGVMAVSVATNDQAELESVKRVLSEQKAANIAIDLGRPGKERPMRLLPS